jgi:hypothetical protein
MDYESPERVEQLVAMVDTIDASMIATVEERDNSKRPLNQSFMAGINEALVMTLYERYRQPRVNGHMLWH